MRLSRVKRIMAREEIDGVLLFNPYNIRYLTGFKPTEGLGPSVVIITQEEAPWLIVPELEFELAKSSWIQNMRTYSSNPPSSGDIETPDLKDCIQEIVESLNLTSQVMGIELDFITVRWFEELKLLFPDAGFKDISSMLAELRMVKDEAELERLKVALQIAECGIRTAIEVIQPGITEIEVAAEVEYTLRKAGATGTGYPTVIASGPHTKSPYTQASAREIRDTEFVVIAISAIYQEYCSDVARTIITGQPTKGQTHLFDCARNSIEVAIEQLTPGINCREIALLVYSNVEEQGYAANLFGTLGHSIGLQPREPPIFTFDNDSPIAPGQVFCIETGLNHSTLGGVYLSATVAHQKDGSFKLLNEVPLTTV
ncbi:MAG: M24 family metallopeptidase [Promethearchaeota archaeon]